ncbi:MAG: thioesterase family protein [Rhodospirillales bacterium]|nr:thioesterase family protein [Rhodospirillales bacterium]
MSGLELYSVEVPEAWTDHYGHMNEGYYVVAASDASWEFQAHLGVGTAYFDETGFAMMTVESHVRYLDEVQKGETLRFESMCLGHDARRAIFGHVMRVDDRICATFEAMTLHYHQEQGVGPMSDEVLAKLATVTPIPLPDWAGRSVAFRKKS